MGNHSHVYNRLSLTYPRVPSSNIQPKAGSIEFFLSTNANTERKPDYDGYILSFGWDSNSYGSWASQLCLASGVPGMQCRFIGNCTDMSESTEWIDVCLCKYVTSLPSSPDPNIYYFIPE